MKRGWITLLLGGAVTLFLIGCSSPMKEAQTMFEAGQYEQLVAKFENNPELATMVQQAKDKIVEKLFAEGKYSTILEMYADNRMAKEAKNKLAEALLAEGKLDEVIAKYGDTPAAMQAKLQQQQMMADSMAKASDEKLSDAEKKIKAKEKEAAQAKDNAAEMANLAAEKELNRIMAIKVPALKKKALQEFVGKAEYKNSPSAKKAADELAKM